MTYINPNSAAYQVFRGISSANNEVSEDNDSTIMDIASKETQSNKSSLTIALEDFSEKFKDFHGHNSSNISAKDAQQGFFAKLFGKEPSNIYETSEAQEYLKENGNLFQSDIYTQAKAHDGGVKYGNGNTYDSALAFAQADIGAIETALSKVHDGGAKVDGKLNYAEIKSYVNSDSVQDLIKTLDLDGDTKTISAEEYASYLIAADGLTSVNEYIGDSFLDSHVDGLIDKENASIAKEFSDIEFKEIAQKIYNEHYSK